MNTALHIQGSEIVWGRIDDEFTLASSSTAGPARFWTSLTDTAPTEYGQTVRWAHAAHTAGLDGTVWMSRPCNTDRAMVLLGDRIGSGDLTCPGCCPPPPPLPPGYSFATRVSTSYVATISSFWLCRIASQRTSPYSSVSRGVICLAVSVTRKESPAASGVVNRQLSSP